MVIALAAATVMAATSAAAATTTAANAHPGTTNGLIAFVQDNQIYTISPSGSGLTQLTTTGENSYPVWNPAGTEIAYEHEATAGVSNIWVMNANGSDQRQWTNTGMSWGNVAWSPSGMTLLFSSDGQWGKLETTSGTMPLQATHDIYGYNEDYPGHTFLAGNNPSWVGGTIAFIGANQVGPTNGKMCDPADGSSDMEQSCVELYSTTTKKFSIPSNSTYGPITAGYGCDGSDSYFQTIGGARLAPDGTNFVFQYLLDNTNCTRSRLRITTLGGAIPTKMGDQQPSYSPDGTSIVLANASTHGAAPNIIIESSTGTDRTTLTPGSEPNWQPVG
jgi:hypothetical protein